MKDKDEDVLILGGPDIELMLQGKETQVIGAVRKAYELHGRGESSLPHSVFLRFPKQPADRIIALPAYLGGDVNSAGVKWIASFPGNLDKGIDRASAVMVLNSADTGRPKAIMEASLISAKRTAASAALAAQVLGQERSDSAGLIGSGPINFEIVRFLRAICPKLHKAIICDLNLTRAEAFAACCEETFDLKTEVARRIEEIWPRTSLISFATTAVTPHVHQLDHQPGTVVLHISLRDLAPEIILVADNIVDDVDHVCRANTSIYLAEQKTGNRGFVRATLAQLMDGSVPVKPGGDSLTVFSPFGLGILDIAVAEYVYKQAIEQKIGRIVPSFLPEPWSSRLHAEIHGT